MAPRAPRARAAAGPCRAGSALSRAPFSLVAHRCLLVSTDKHKTSGPKRASQDGTAKPTPAVLSTMRNPGENVPQGLRPEPESPLILAAFGRRKRTLSHKLPLAPPCDLTWARHNVAPVSSTQKAISGHGVWVLRAREGPRSNIPLPYTPHPASSPLSLKLCLNQQLKHN